MTRLDTLTESNGPDRFNTKVGCADHHAGVRTGIKDYCCCCDPCQYYRKNESASDPADRHCCRCIPKLILAKFTADNGDDCCRNVVVPMLATIATAMGRDVIQWSGSIVGHAITIYQSNESASGYTDPEPTCGTITYQWNDPPGEWVVFSNDCSEGCTPAAEPPFTGLTDGQQETFDCTGTPPAVVTGCRWTILIPTLGIDEEIAIDHTTVTCLGVPSISISSVAAFDNCVGTISLMNYSTVKVPFQTRGFISDTPDDGMTVPFPEGYSLEGCETLPRYICITKKHNHEGRIRSQRVSWEIEWWRDFRWDADFAPYYDYEEEENIIARWKHTPKDSTAFVQHLYLIQDAYGGFYLQPDFNSPAGTNGDGEDFQRVPLSSCGCDFKILDVRPVDDPSPPAEPGQSLSTDLLGIDMRGGRCGCWDYACGQRRCVPRYLCGYVYAGATVYRNVLFTWSNSAKCWASSGGIGLDGYDMPFDLSICLRQGDDGECELFVEHEDYELNTLSIGSTETVIAGTFEGTNSYGNDYFSLNFSTSFDGDCELLLNCTVATPCADDCGSHPPLLNLRLRGWSTVDDIPPGPRECETEMTLVFQQTVVVSGSGILVTCKYVGFALVGSDYYDPATETESYETMLIKAELSLGSVIITRRLAANPDVILQTESAILDTEYCDPYYGYYFTLASLKSCFFGDTATFFHRWEAEITEI